jgi:hypothetical protein
MQLHQFNLSLRIKEESFFQYEKPTIIGKLLKHHNASVGTCTYFAMGG